MWVYSLLCCLLVAHVHGELAWNLTMDGFILTEELETNTLVYTLEAYDEATLSSEGIVYGFNNKLGGANLVLEDKNGIFIIERGTGRVYTRGAIDYENQRDLRSDFTLYLLAKREDDSDGNQVVPVLIPEDARSPLDFVSTREVRRRAGIPDKNDYLFPIVGRTQGRQSHARAYSSLKRTCGECSLVAPTRINSVYRKYTATLTQFVRQQSTISLLNINDNAPQFQTTDKKFVNESEENIPPEGLLLFEGVKAEDPDKITVGQGFITGGIVGCAYTNNVTDADCEGAFRLVQYNLNNEFFIGDIFLMKPLDFETYPVITILLNASDGEMTGLGNVAVTVVNIQDRPPRWTKLNSTVKTNELNINLPMVVEAVDGDNLGRPVYYTIIPGQTYEGIPVEDIFAIDPFTGVLSNIITLDLEDEQHFRDYGNNIIRNNWRISLMACEIESTNPLVLSNECTPTGRTTIQIADLNDNAPLHMTGNLYTYYIFENEPNNRALDDPSIDIFDRDTELYNRFTTEFLNGEPREFSIAVPNGNPSIRIKNGNLLDMDTFPISYEYVLRTFDINDPSLSSTATVIINLMDRNDNKPYFLVDEYTATVRENVQNGHQVTTVKAYDIDYDTANHGNNSIRYSLLGAYSELFTIDAEFGVIRVQTCPNEPRHGVFPCIDYDSDVRVYQLEVVATDNKTGNVAKASNVPLTIQVLGVNDNPPRVPDYFREIREGQKRFTPPLEVRGTDADDRDGVSSLRYSIFRQEPGNFWVIDPVSGIITVNLAETGDKGIKFTDGTVGQGMFDLEVQVTDGNYTVISNVQITVLDENDNAPRFTPPDYEFFIPETTPAGEFIAQLTAIDADDPSTENGQLRFSIFQGNVGGKFRIDEEGAGFYVAPGAKFDYDNNRLYTLTAIVNDLGTPQLTGEGTIIVHILNANNKSPKVIPFVQPFYCYENWQIGAYVGTIKAFDPDADAQLEFEFVDPRRAFTSEGNELFVSSYNYLNLFTLDPDTGVIYVNSNNLSSDLTRDLIFKVRVSDVAPTPVQHGFGTITIEVRPFNSRPPIFQPYDTPIRVPEELPPGSLLISLIARDDNGINRYEIIEQPDDFFIITRNTGSVNIKNSVDYDDARRTNDSYFVVEVYDTGIPQLSSTALVEVEFYNINDNYPYFVNPDTDEEQFIYFGYIEENSPDGTPVTIVKALDNDRPDDNGYHLVRYLMEDQRFDVHPVLGNVSVLLQPGQELDREQNNRILALVLARDNPDGPRSNQNQAAAMIQIELLDVNDNPPIFSKLEYEVTIFETISVNTVILQVFTSDLDIGRNAESVYTKVEGKGNDTEDFFAVMRNSGRIIVQSSLLRKARTYPYIIYVQAMDNRGEEPGFKTEAKVSIYVKQSANSPPRWVIPPRANMTIFVLEEQYNGMLVYDVKAVDDDTGNNGIIDYSFIYEGQTTQTTPEFQINRVNGMIHAQIVYDREKVDRYVLLLKATDRGTTPLEATRFLTIVVKDVNDHPPVFALNDIEFRVREDHPVNKEIGVVEATDLDLDPVILYEIISGNEEGIFKIDRQTGNITLAQPLDSERRSVYYLDVRARNKEPEYTVIRNRRKRAIDPSIITVKILVGDINDIAPQFLQDMYYGCVSTRSPYDKHILTATARDYDAVGSGIVRYRMAGGNFEDGKKLFDIHPKYGVLTNKVLMRNYANRIFSMKVNARDAESVEDSESGNVTAMVFVTMPGTEVKLLITQHKGEVRLYQNQIQSIIEEADDLEYLCINEISDHVTESSSGGSTLWSDVFVSGVRRNANGDLAIVSGIELRNIISREISSRRQDFDLLYIKEVELASSSDEVRLEDKAVLIILIIIAVLIFLVIIFCIVAFMCIRAARTGQGLCDFIAGSDEDKQQKKQILVHKTHNAPVPVMVVHEPEPEPVIYDNQTTFQRIEQVQVPEPEPEPVVISQVVEETRVIEQPTYHVQYATVQKRSPSPEPVHFDYEDQEAIVVELDNDNDEPTSPDVYIPAQIGNVGTEDEYRIVATVDNN